MKQIALVLAACVGWGCYAGTRKGAPAGNSDVVAPPVQDAGWEAIVADGDRMFFVGNSYTGNEGGLPIHLERAWPHASLPLRVETEAAYFWGKPLGAMLDEKVVRAIETGKFDVCVITSGTVAEMERFVPLTKKHCEHLVVYMTWGRNPTISTMESYREETASIVADMRAFEAKTEARVVPSGLVFYDLVVRPPRPGLRVDWLYFPENIHQNGAGTAINVFTFYAALVGESPIGMQYELSVGEDVIVQRDRVATAKAEDGSYRYDEIVFDEEFRATLQQRTWDVTEAWFAKKTEFD